MRDKIKDDKYFEIYVQEEIEAYEKFRSMLFQIPEEDREKEKGMIARLIVCNRLYNVADGLYSKGNPVEEIKRIYSVIADYEVKTWSLEKGSGYLSLLKTLSLAVLLNAEKEEIDKLKELLKKENVKDYLIDYMMNYLDKNWGKETEELMFKSPFNKLKKVTS